MLILLICLVGAVLRPDGEHCTVGSGPAPVTGMCQNPSCPCQLHSRPGEEHMLYQLSLAFTNNKQRPPPVPVPHSLKPQPRLAGQPWLPFRGTCRGHLPRAGCSAKDQMSSDGAIRGSHRMISYGCTEFLVAPGVTLAEPARVILWAWCISRADLPHPQRGPWLLGCREVPASAEGQVTAAAVPPRPVRMVGNVQLED